jgi:glycoside/pentoside/hexuronide:cation symporter, GPH family
VSLEPAPVSSRNKWLYALVNAGIMLPYSAVGAFLIFYYTDIKKLSPVLMGAVTAVYAVYNAGNNVVLGHLSDRTRSRWGRRIPYVRLSSLPFALCFALLWLAPFDAQTQTVSLLAYLALGMILWEGFGTAIGTGYYSLLPEMFPDRLEQTDVSVRMNIVQTAALLGGTVLPSLLVGRLGWFGMGVCLGAVCLVCLTVGAKGLFERHNSGVQTALPLWPAIYATFSNRAFLLLMLAQTMRHLSTNTLAGFMPFFVKYSLETDSTQGSLALGAAFITAALALPAWRKLATRLGARGTLLTANAWMMLATTALLFVPNIQSAMVVAVLIGLGFSGLILMGDVVLSDVIDEDQLRTGTRREGMYFGTISTVTSLSGILTGALFGLTSQLSGYRPVLETQPATVGVGFRLMLALTPAVASGVAVLALLAYPLHGRRLEQIRLEQIRLE